MIDFLLPENVRTAVVEYLAGRPWREVANLMPALLTLKAADLGPRAGEGIAGVDDPAVPEKE